MNIAREIKKKPASDTGIRDGVSMRRTIGERSKQIFTGPVKKYACCEFTFSYGETEICVLRSYRDTKRPVPSAKPQPLLLESGGAPDQRWSDERREGGGRVTNCPNGPEICSRSVKRD